MPWCWGACRGAQVCAVVPRCVQWCPGAKLCRTPLRIADPHPFPNNPLGPLPAHAASRGGLRAGRAGGNPLAALPCTYCCGFGVWLGLVPLQEAAARVFAWRGSASARQRTPAREGFGVVCQGSGFLFFFPSSEVFQPIGRWKSTSLVSFAGSTLGNNWCAITVLKNCALFPKACVFPCNNPNPTCFGVPVEIPAAVGCQERSHPQPGTGAVPLAGQEAPEGSLQPPDVSSQISSCCAGGQHRARVALDVFFFSLPHVLKRLVFKMQRIQPRGGMLGLRKKNNK